jgi:hypothetical protein
MIALRLVRLIEAHHEELAQSLMRKVEKCFKCAELKKIVPRREIEAHVSEVYRHLSDWLLDKAEHDIFVTYTALAGIGSSKGSRFISSSGRCNWSRKIFGISC